MAEGAKRKAQGLSDGLAGGFRPGVSHGSSGDFCQRIEIFRQAAARTRTSHQF